MNLIEENLIALKKSITSYEQRYHRESGSVHLLAVSKGQAIEKIMAAIQAGQLAFGENYLQEALAKMSAINNPSIEWHFIGPVQSNKTRKIAAHFAWLHSLADKKIAIRLNDQRPAHLPPLNICIEVNVSAEKSKSGVNMAEVKPLMEFCAKLPHLKLRGLMTIPAMHDNFEDQRQEFHKLFVLSRSLCEQGFALDTLSMGMSDDFEAAIAEGSTIVRIGTALFGAREKKPLQGL